MLVELHERIIPVILARDICAQAAELLQLLLDVLCGCLDVRFDPADVFLMVHFCPRISDDSDVLREELVSVLEGGSVTAFGRVSGGKALNLRVQREPGTMLC